ncbi:uncharacterized protein LOC110445376 [Mizuhopecten yessoensis]|uniref:uncharacterized protein LOC110445376 n=1 Tax=Mizuhopecten yessoensis TaxID=6573 RepID=UPI000B457838|nr:uncharacterized protein LOC110445376 [Mizuhopecten yessoensis]
MAEGRLGHEHSSVDGAVHQSLDSHLLECPICLEQLRQPKSLAYIRFVLNAWVATSLRSCQKASITGCGKHKEKMEYYCEDHQIMGCNKCIIVDHRRCEVVTSAEDFRDKLRKSSQIDDLLEELRKSAEAMEILIKDVGEQLKTMTLDQDTVLQSLTDIRKKIDERFDVLQKDLTDN